MSFYDCCLFLYHNCSWNDSGRVLLRISLEEDIMSRCARWAHHPAEMWNKQIQGRLPVDLRVCREVYSKLRMFRSSPGNKATCFLTPCSSRLCWGVWDWTDNLRVTRAITLPLIPLWNLTQVWPKKLCHKLMLDFKTLKQEATNCRVQHTLLRRYTEVLLCCNISEGRTFKVVFPLLASLRPPPSILDIKTVIHPRLMQLI